MTVVGYLRERPAPALPEVSRDRTAATTVRDLNPKTRLAARVPWCWPALLTLALGFYQAQAALVRQHYRLTVVRHAPSLTVFVLVRT